MKKPVSIEAVKAVWEATTPTSRLGRWFAQHHGQFNELKRPRWLAMAAMFAEEGLIEVPAEFWSDEDTPEKQLARRRAAEAARQIWQRVKRQQKAAAKPASLPLVQTTPAVPSRFGTPAPRTPPTREPAAEPAPFVLQTLKRPSRKKEE
jgi:hypothetical protein